MSDVIRFPHLIEAVTQTAPALENKHDLTVEVKMSDLYEAPIKTKRTDHLQSVAETVSERIPRHSPQSDAATGWDNQELADLYRTQRILALAGITTKVDHGLTDEGDPWFIFMDSAAEVFVHFSRIDDRYLVTSVMQEKPVWGSSLRDLVSEFSQQVQPATESSGAKGNVVSIAGRSRNAVLIHPAAALAALVWSVYITSDNLIATTPMLIADDATDAVLPALHLHDPIQDLDILPKVSQDAMQGPSNHDLGKQVVDSYTSREIGAVSLQMTALSTGISMKAVGLSLSFVALSVGLPSLESNEEIKAETEQNQLSIAQLYAFISNAKEASMSILIATQDGHQSTSQTEHLVDDMLPQQATTTTSGADTRQIETSMEFAELMQSITKSYGTDVQTMLALKQTSAVRSPQKTQTETVSEDSDVVLAAEISLESVNTPKPVYDGTLADNSLMLRFDTTFDSFELSSLDTLNQTELTALLTTDPTVEIADLLASEAPTSKFEAFDQEAQMFLDFLLRTHSDIKVINLPTEIIFIHMDALAQADTDHPIYAKSWSFDDGGVISTIGLKSDLAQFDLIA